MCINSKSSIKISRLITCLCVNVDSPSTETMGFFLFFFTSSADLVLKLLACMASTVYFYQFCIALLSPNGQFKNQCNRSLYFAANGLGKENQNLAVWKGKIIEQTFYFFFVKKTKCKKCMLFDVSMEIEN